MRAIAAVALLAGALAGCREGRESTVAPPVVVAEPPAPSPASPPEPSTYVLTPETLKRYLGYQQRMVEVYGATLEAMRALDRSADGPSSDALSALRENAESEEAARTALGLSARDVEVIDEMVAAVVTKRSLARTLQYEEALQTMALLRDSLPPEKRAAIEETMKEMRRQHEVLTGLPEERRKYGAANVELLLTEEAALTRNHDALIARASRGAAPSGSTGQ